jgi:hypothetical protein
MENVEIRKDEGGSRCLFTTQSTADGQRSTAHLIKLQNLFLVVSGEKVANHKGELSKVGVVEPRPRKK